MFRIIFIILMMMFFAHTQATAQDSCNLSVQLIVLEVHNAEPISGLMLYFTESKMNYETDEKGTVLLEHICAGTYHVHLHSFEVQDTTIILFIDKSGAYHIDVNHSAHVLNLVEVHNQQEKTVLQHKEVLTSELLQANSGKTISEQLKNINGVSTLNNGSTISKPVIHGLHSNRILMLNNGIRQEDQQWGNEHAPNIDPFVANRITVLKGAAGVRYGTDAMGGVVLVEPSAIRTDVGWGAHIHLAAFSNNRMGLVSSLLEHRFSKMPSLSFRIQGTAKQGGNYQIPGGYWVANTGLKEFNYASTIAYNKAHRGVELFYSSFKNTLGIYKGSHTGSQQDLQNAINSDTPLIHTGFSYTIDRPRQEVSHQLLKLKTYLDNKSGVWNLVYAYQNNFRKEFDVMRVDNGKAQLNLKLNTHSLNLNLDHKKIKNISGQVGVEAVSQHNTFMDGDRVFIPSYYGFSTAGYAIERYSKNDWTFEAGIRYDYKHYEMYNPEGKQYTNVRYLFDYRNPSATLSLKHQANQHLEWIATLSQAWRAPQASELFSAGFHQGGARIEYGNRNLHPESSVGFNLASHYSIEHKLTVDASLYAQSIRNFIFLSPSSDVLTIRGYYKTFNYLQTNALMSGLDIKGEYLWNKHWSTDAKSSILYARDMRQNDWLILMPSNRVSIGTKYAYDFNKKIINAFVSVNGQYVFKQNRVPKNFDQLDNLRPPDGYLLIEANAGFELNVFQKTMQCSIVAGNLLNTKYRDYLDVFRYFIDQPGTNIVLRCSLSF